MLIDQFEGQSQSGSWNLILGIIKFVPPGCPNYRTHFKTELNTMGFPLTTRNVSIAMVLEMAL
jgi:hypothetical protein